MNIPKDTDRRAFFESLREEAVTAYTDVLENIRLAREQYEGSPKIDGSDEEASAVRNITYELIESQISPDIPEPKVDSYLFTEEKGRRALAIERLCRQSRMRLDLEEFNNCDERYTYVYGGSIWHVEWDEEGGAHGEGGIAVRTVSPECFIPEPSVTELDEMDYCFILARASREALAERYALSEEARASLADDGGSAGTGASYTVCYYRGEEGEVSRFIWSGEVTLADEVGVFRRRRVRCAACGRALHLCHCGSERKEVDECTLTESALPFIHGPSGKKKQGTAAMASLYGEIPYFVPDRFPLILRRNTVAEGRLLGQSDCLIIRSQQQQINKIESRIHQKLMRAGITPMMPEDARITLNNSVFGQVLKLREGEHAGDYGTIDTTPSIAQDITQAERLYRQAKRVIGITDTYQGESDVYAQSGVAKQLQIAQAAGRLESKRRMKQAAYARLYRMIFEFHLAYADTARPLSFRDAMGRAGKDVWNRYDFLGYDARGCRFYYDTDYLFSCDKNESPELSREILWQKNLENLRSGTLGDPTSPMTLLRYWRSQEQARYPFARENVEYFESLLSNAREEKGQLLLTNEAGGEQSGQDNA